MACFRRSARLIPSATVWDASPVANMLTGRAEFASATGVDGRIYVFGGYDDNYEFVLQTEVYDPGSNSWTSLADMPSGRVDFAAATGSDGRIYVLGGYDSNYNIDSTVDVYDPATNAWTTVASMPSPRVYLGATAGPGGQIYAVGGYDPSAGYVGTVDAFDPATNIWISLPSMSLGRAYLAAATGADGRVLALGGYGSNFQVNSSVEALSGVALVTDPDFQATGRPVDATEQIAFTAVVASFTDDDPIGNFTATINWGDGTSSAGSISANSSGGFDVAGDHTYAVPGSFRVERDNPRRQLDFDRHQQYGRGTSSAQRYRRCGSCDGRTSFHRHGRPLHGRSDGLGGGFYHDHRLGRQLDLGRARSRPTAAVVLA